MERRQFVEALSMRASESGKDLRVEGYAARYDVLSYPIPTRDGKQFRERIVRGAFEQALATKPDVVCLFNHDQNVVLGRTTSGTLTLRSDDKGLWFSCLLPDTTAGRDIYASVKRGDVNGCSFAFQVDDNDDDWSQEYVPDYRDANKSQNWVVRTIKRFARLMDCSLVVTPAYPDTEVMARNALVPADVRSRFEKYSTRTRRDVWADICDHYGVDPESDATIYDLVAHERRVARRRRDVLELL